MAVNNSEWLEEGVNTHNRATIKEVVLKYLSYLPLLILSVALCIGAGMLYLYYATPKYNISESILIKNKQSASSTSNTPSNDLLTIALDGGSTMNIDNEIQLLHSVSLMERIVQKNNLNISYYKIKAFKKTELYPASPFRLIQKDSGAIKKFLRIKLDNITKTNASAGITGDGTKPATFTITWDQPFEAGGSRFVLSPDSTMAFENIGYMVECASVNSVANAIANDVSITIPDKKTTIIKLSLLAANVERSKNILNWIVQEYNQSNIEEKNKLARSTIQFIDDRLNIITNELSGVEGNIEVYRGSSRLIDVQTQATQSFENTNAISKNINDLSIQQRVVDILQNYFNDPLTQDKLVPSNLGINDATLISLITRYNELQSKRQREAPQLAPNSIVLQDLDAQISNVKGSIKENLANIKKNLQLQEASHKEKEQEYQGFISALPKKQRVLQDITRKQTITEGLYLYLLQKREETAISFSASNASTYKQIDPPQASEKPAEPNSTVVKLGSLLLGFLITFGWIKFREATNDKITTKGDLIHATPLPVIGEISHVSDAALEGLPVFLSETTGEQFRTIRTNISLSEKNQNQCILVTSSANDDGKSLVSKNLAAVLAMPGKKVALLDFDFRNPDYTENDSKGITGFLSGNASSLSEIYQKSPDIATLHIFPAGTIPANPGDLLLNENINTLFTLLKKEYEYIVVNTASAALVSDAFILGKHSDLTLYVVRLKYTVKKQINFLNELFAHKKLHNINIVLNDIKL